MNEKMSFEMYRLQLLNAIIAQCSVQDIDPNEDEDYTVHDWNRYRNFAYALSNRIYPYFESFDKLVLEAFSDSVYDIPKSFLDDLYTYLDNQESQYIKENHGLPPLTYYTIERDNGGKINRWMIIPALQYAKLNSRFLWVFSMLNDNNESPIEAHSLSEKVDFQIKNISLV